MNSNGQMLFLHLADIEWVQAADRGVELRVGRQTHRLRDTFAALAAKLPPDRFLRISPWVLVNMEQIKELQPMVDGRYEVRLRNGTRLTLKRGYCGNQYSEGGTGEGPYRKAEIGKAGPPSRGFGAARSRKGRESPKSEG